MLKKLKNPSRIKTFKAKQKKNKGRSKESTR